MVIKLIPWMDTIAIFIMMTIIVTVITFIVMIISTVSKISLNLISVWSFTTVDDYMYRLDCWSFPLEQCLQKGFPAHTYTQTLTHCTDVIVIVLLQVSQMTFISRTSWNTSARKKNLIPYIKANVPINSPPQLPTALISLPLSS